MGQIVIFSRSNCRHCKEAKDILGKLDIPFTEIDIGNDLRNRMLMSHISKRYTVPQIFFNDHHIGGTSELKKLGAETIKIRAAAALEQPQKPSFLSTSYDDNELKSAIMPIAAILEPYLPDDPTTIPEYAPVTTWYKGMFGFLCNLYDQMILKPEPTALWIAALSSLIVVVEKKVGRHFGTVCFATAMKAGCAYCSAHGADLSIKYAEETPEHFKVLIDFLTTDNVPLEKLPFTDREKVFINLAAKMTLHSVTEEDIEHARTVFGVNGLRDACASVGAMGCIMGYLNRFNDLVGVEIEASIKGAIDGSIIGEGWDWGTHDTEEQGNRYQFSDEERLADVNATDLAALVKSVKDRVFNQVEPILKKYEAFPDNLLPAWIANLPDADTIRTIGCLYHSAFNTGDIDPQTKHLAAYALASGSHYLHIMNEEKRIVLAMSDDAKTTNEKLDKAAKFALDSDYEQLSHFDTKEQLALRLAKSAESFPHIVRGDLVLDLSRHFTAVQIVELVISLAVIGMAQRWSGILEPLITYTQGMEG